MPSIRAKLFAWVLRTTGMVKKQFSGGPDFPVHRAKALAGPIDPPASLSRQINVSESAFQGRKVWTLAPKDRAETATILFWHGGGYVYPPSPFHWKFLAHMTQVHGWRVVAPLYPLAPEHDALVINGFALDFYREFAEARRGAPFLMGGDSAGGGLAAVTVMSARAAHLPLPEKLLLICPWLDMAPDHPDQRAIEPRDAILSIQGIREAGAMYAGSLATNEPEISPIYGDWTGLPPILAFGGGDDILVTNARALKAKLPGITYDEQAGMIHDWPIFGLPESRAAQAKMAAFAGS
jgi:epsilon-lactone hydrolase